MFPNTIVVGGGIAGLAIAAALARNGTAVTLLEQAPAITEVGAGLQISPNGMVMLRKLGLANRLARHSVQAEAVVLEDFRQGRDVARIGLKGQGAYHFVHRADLVSLLYQAARQNNVTFELGAKATRIEPGPLPQVHLADGTKRQAKLVVCADGLHSVGRAVLNGAAEPFFTKHVAWRALVPTDGASLPEARVSMGPGRHIVRYPLRDGRLMNLVAIEERDDWTAEGWNHAGDADELRKRFADFGGAAGDLIAKVQTTQVWGLFRHPVAPVWYRDGVALMGDAAHPTLPFLAQGANMALEDAYALFHCVERETLDAYRDIRFDRVSRVIETSSKNAWRYHLRPGPLRLAAHAGLSVVSKVAPRLMAAQFDWLYRYDIEAALDNPALRG